MSWHRYRFHANLDDPRPVEFPPPGPYWISGEGEDYSIVVAFLPSDVDLRRYWPEASDVDHEDCEAITYTSRFPKPDWYEGA